MTLAQKYFHKHYNKSDTYKPTNDEWKVINMMHECLREHNQPKLPVGTMLIERKALVNYVTGIAHFISEIDVIFKDDKTDVGSKVAKAISQVEYRLDCVKHFQLKVPLERLKEPNSINLF